MTTKAKTKDQLQQELNVLQQRLSEWETAEAGREQVEKTLRRQNAYLTALHETTLGLISHLNLTDLLKTIVERAGAIMGTPDGYIYLFDPEQAELKVRIGLGRHSGNVGFRIKPGEGLAGKVWQTGQPLILDDYAAWPGRLPDPRFDRIHAAVGVPLKSGSKIIGMIALTYGVSREISADEIAVLTQFADLACVALENAKLYAAMQQELEERKQMEVKLQVEKGYFEHLFENAPEAIILIDNNSNVLRMNGEFTRMFGYTRAEVLGRPIDTLLPPKDRFAEADSITKQAIRGERIQIETVRRHKDGTPLPVSVLATPIKIGYGQAAVYTIYHDLTKHKKAEEELRRLQEFNREIVQTMAEGIIVLDADGHFTFINPAAAALYQYELQELIGRHWTVTVPADQQPIIEAADERRRRGEADHYEVQLLRKDGSRFPVLLSGKPRFAQGKFIGTLSAFMDITTHKRTEEIRSMTGRIAQAVYTTENLNELFKVIRQELERFLNTANFYIALYHPERDTLSFPYFIDEKDADNPGTSPEDVPAGKSLTGYLLRNEKSLLLAHEQLLQMIRSGEVELRGTLAKVWAGVPLRAKGKVIGALVVQNYTDEKAFGEKEVELLEFVSNQIGLSIEYKRAENALRESEEKYKHLYNESRRAEELYRSLIYSSPDAILIYDLQEHIVYASSFFTKLFGWSLEEIKGNPLAFVPESEKAPSRTRIDLLLKNGTPYHAFETRRLTKDGRSLDVSISASRYDDHEGRPAGMLKILRDMTHTRKLQAQLQHAQKMESIGTIASGVAHNFRNILAGISLQSQLMQARFRDHPAALEIGEMIAGGVKRGAQLVDGLMHFSRKEGTKDFTVMKAPQMILDVYDLIRKSFDKKIDIRIELAESLLVMGNPSELSQVIMNLCVNARDAMPNGGVLYISAHQKRDRAEIIISDSGHGMDKETLIKCFDPFFTTKEVGKGTGLGLSTSYGIIKEHGGDIHVYSEKDLGTTFKIYLPLVAAAEDTVKETSPGPSKPGKGQKILIVDDEIHILKPLEELLVLLDYQVLALADGLTALEKYKVWQPDAVLMDRNMPEMDGVTCAGRILQQDPQAKIILISGYNQMGANGIDEKVKKWIAGYLTKPIDMAELTELLQRLFAGK